MTHLSDFELRDRPWWTAEREREYVEALQEADHAYHAAVDLMYESRMRSLASHGSYVPTVADVLYIMRTLGFSQAEAVQRLGGQE